MYYLFGTPFNRFFLVYEALFVLPAVALILGVSKIQIARVGEAFKPGTPRKLISGFMLLPAVILSVLWIGETTVATVSGSVPDIVPGNGWMTHLPAVFDLSMIVTPLLFGAVWLWQSRPWGYVTASIVLIQGGLYTIVLVAAAGVSGAWDQVPIWGALGAGCILFGVMLLANIRSGSRTRPNEEPSPRSRSK